jgi:glycosyl transferase family 25
MPKYIISDISVINLERSQDRRKKMENELNKIPSEIPRSRWIATDGKKMSIEELDKICDKNCKGWTGEKRFYGQVGCYLSHKTLIESLLNKKVNPNAGHLILEDDIVIDDNFKDKWLKIIPHLPNDWEILFLDVQKNGEIKMKNIKNGIGEFVSGWGTHGYMIKHSKIPDILTKINKMYAPIDNMLQEENNNIKKYILEDNLVKITGQDGSVIG